MPHKEWTIKTLYIKVTGIRPMAPVLNRGPLLRVSKHEMLSFSVRKEIIENDNSFILLSKVGENGFLQTL